MPNENTKRRGAPLLPTGAKVDARLITQFTDKEADDIRQYARACGIKMATLYRRAISSFIDSRRMPPDEIKFTTQEGRHKRKIIYMSPELRSKVISLAREVNIKDARLLRFMILDYIKNTPARS